MGQGAKWSGGFKNSQGSAQGGAGVRPGCKAESWKGELQPGLSPATGPYRLRLRDQDSVAIAEKVKFSSQAQIFEPAA